jgi:hypothetical protein
MTQIKGAKAVLAPNIGIGQRLRLMKNPRKKNGIGHKKIHTMICSRLTAK